MLIFKIISNTANDAEMGVGEAIAFLVNILMPENGYDQNNIVCFILGKEDQKK